MVLNVRLPPFHMFQEYHLITHNSIKVINYYIFIIIFAPSTVKMKYYLVFQRQFLVVYTLSKWF